MSFMKRLIELIKRKKLKKYQRMNSEILCAIAHQVYKEQSKESVNIPAFQEINQRYNSLHISTPKDLERTYFNFYLKDLVSGIEL